MIEFAATPDAIRHLCRTLRAINAAEIFPNNFLAGPDDLAAQVIVAAPHAVGLAALGEDTSRPAVAVGVMPVAPGRGVMLWLANDGFLAISPAVHRWWFRAFVPRVLMRFRRVEFVGLRDPVSDRWRAWVGFRLEGTAVAYGRAGEDFGHWAWVHPDWRPEN